MQEPNASDIHAVLIASDIEEVKRELATLVNVPELGCEIDPFGIYCQKTGWLIGTRNETSLFQLIEICGKDVSENLYNGVSLNVHPAWLSTDSDSLDTLMDSDPIGYSVYCFGLITKQFYQSAKNYNSKLFPCSDRYWALVRASKLMQERGAASLAELNTELARFITFMPDTDDALFNSTAKQVVNIVSRHIREYAKQPDQLAALHCSGELLPLLQQITNHVLDAVATVSGYVHRTRFIDIAATVEEAARGPSNVRRQRKSQRQVIEASLFTELNKMFADSGLDKQIQSENLPGSTAWRAKYEHRADKQEAVLAAQLAEIAGLTNLALPEEDINSDADDYKVEVRKLEPTPQLDPKIAYKSQGGTWEQVKAMQESLSKQPQHKLSALELMRARRARK